MTYQKLTYSGSTCNNYVYFSFDADYFDTDMITHELKIKPTSVKRKADPVPKFTSWDYKIVAGSEINLELYLEKLIDVFESKIEDIIRLKNTFKLETRIQFVIDIDINPESSTPYFGLNQRAIDFLSRTKTTVDFDIYKSDTIGLLEKSRGV